MKETVYFHNRTDLNFKDIRNILFVWHDWAISGYYCLTDLHYTDWIGLYQMSMYPLHYHVSFNQIVQRTCEEPLVGYSPIEKCYLTSFSLYFGTPQEKFLRKGIIGGQ